MTEQGKLTVAVMVVKAERVESLRESIVKKCVDSCIKVLK